ncbi:hypothetical protein NEMBOFW57_008999 [Staphylotrichum longicolle]|uniref:DUF7580 domain-containing protein n=1 Tax=Staphylotrichum longicolle TaxID=669026 RepID=A0AAD4EWN5_9PEZI|nr:hypothetical protein NEMBOFW57_008999 [Staphylotrichum longicolle]
MSGVELIVGTALGSIPIVLEVYDRYDKVLKAFRTFRHPSPELNCLGATLGMQKMLFASDIIKVRDALTDNPDRARNLLSEVPDWAAFQLHGLSKARAECLRGLFTSWKENVDQIHRNLQVIEGEVESVRSDGQTGKPMGSLGRRIKLAFKKDKMQEAIKELRRFTYDFTQLTVRIIEDLRIPNTNGGSHVAAREASCQKPGHWKSLELYRQVQAASSCLNCVKLEASVRPSQTKESPLWLEVEFVDSTQRSQPAVKDLEFEQNWVDLMDKLQQHTRQLTLEPNSRPAKKAKVVRLKAVTPLGKQETDNSPTPVQQPAKANSDGQASAAVDVATSLNDIEDACKSFLTAPSGHCIAYDIAHLQHSGQCRLSRAAKAIPDPSKISLAELIAWFAEDEISRHLPRSSTALLATSLSSAVLQYHSTPWLPDIWQSSHVRFYGTSHLLQSAEELLSSSPHFEVEFSKSNLKGKGHDLTACARATGVVARNKILFHFGIILLELGYSRPWAQLVESVGNTLPLGGQSEYDVAEKLSRGYPLLNKMGPKFPIIVRKCLGCDFGTGESDLQNENLQETMHIEEQRFSIGLKTTYKMDLPIFTILMIDDVGLGLALSEFYFAAIQLLRIAPEWVQEALDNLEDLVFVIVQKAALPGSPEADEAATEAVIQSWESVLVHQRHLAKPLLSRITRKQAELNSLKNGLFNATSVNEATKPTRLNHYILVFTVVTIFYLPLSFVAAPFALGMFSWDDPGQKWSFVATVPAVNCGNGFGRDWRQG